MVDLQATNAKLRARSERMVAEVCGVDRDAARPILDAAGGSVKIAIVMHALGVPTRRSSAAGGAAAPCGSAGATTGHE